MDEQDGYALVSQLNELSEEILKAKSDFEQQTHDLKRLHRRNIEARDKKINILITRNCDLEKGLGVMECNMKEYKICIDDNEQYSQC